MLLDLKFFVVDKLYLFWLYLLLYLNAIVIIHLVKLFCD